MNRKSKIIVSVVGISIVLLALLGLTYAFYLTRIIGNTNETSISITTAKLELVYGDNHEEIIRGDGALEPVKEVKEDNKLGKKDFTVTNTGDASSYVVIIDNVSITKDGVTTTFLTNDFRYTLTCEVRDKNGNKINNKTCNDATTLSTFPINGGVLLGNEIDAEEVHAYTLKLWYIDNGYNQSDDMGKMYNARVSIADVTQMENPFTTGVTVTDNTSLAYNIIQNAKENTNGTKLLNIPETKVAEEISSVTNYKTTGEEATFAKDMSSVSSNASKTWYYYDTYVVDETSGNFTLTGKQSCTYSSCYNNLVGKYLYNTSASNNSNANNHTSDTKTNLSKVYKVTEATSSSLKYVQVFSSPNEAERVLVPTTDDYGTSYYFRGNVEDNYVNFAGMCWRIVRIEGDGSVKLILEDRNEQCNDKEGQDLNNNGTYFTGNWSDGNTYVFGYDDNYRLNFLNYEGGLADSFKTFQTSLATKISEKYTGESLSDKLKIEEWCYDDKVTATQSWGWDDNNDKDFTLSDFTDEFYGAYTRINANKKPSLNCTGTKLTKFRDNTDMYVGTLTADEMSFAGATSSTNYNYYLMNNYSKSGSKGLYFWSLSPGNFGEDGGGYAFGLNNIGDLFYDAVSSDDYSRPAVSLKSGSIITGGEGTLEKPYIIG